MEVEQNITELKEEVGEVSSKEVERGISSEKVETAVSQEAKVAMAELKALEEEEEERAGEEDRYMLGSDNNEVKLDLLSGCVFMYLQ